MTPPQLVSEPPFVYPDRAVPYEVQGIGAAVCAITIEGTVVDCGIVKSLPFMDKAVVRALTAARFTPAMQDGKPVEVDSMLSIEIRLR